MDFSIIVLICVCVAAVLCCIYWVVNYYLKSKKIKSKYKIDKGMSYEAVKKILGEPATKNENGSKITYTWEIQIENKKVMAKGVFQNNTLRSIG